MYGLLERDINYIISAVEKYPEVKETILFGSRAMGNHKKGSDVDLAIIGKRIDGKTVRRLSDDLNEEYPLPYFFDVVNYSDISNEELKKYINSVGQSIYRR